MVKTITDEYGNIWETSKIIFYSVENGGALDTFGKVVAYDGNTYIATFYDYIDELELTDEEVKKLYEEGSI